MAVRRNTGRTAPAWLITFADLMSLLVCFFVLIISYSVPDKAKLKIAAGSIRDAFGISEEIVVTGVVELDGNPVHKFAQDLAPQPLDDVIGPVPDNGSEINYLSARERYLERVFEDEAEEALGADAVPPTDAAAVEREIRQAMQSVPDLARLEDNLIIDHTPEGLRIQLVDQARRSMFPLGSARMYEPTASLLREVAAAIEDVPNRVAIAGHTDGRQFPGDHAYDNWSLSMERADATRRVLLGAGLDAARLAEVTGKADTAHMFPDDPLDPRNRRISITLLQEAPSPTRVGADAAHAARRNAAGSGRSAGALAFDFVETRSLAPHQPARSPLAGSPWRADGAPTTPRTRSD